MKLKKKLVLFLATAGVLIVSLQFAPAPPPPLSATLGQENFDRFPPVPQQYWVQLLHTPLANGNNMIMRIRYESDTVLPQIINVYSSETVMIPFYDDGTGPDAVRGDGIYAAYLTEDVTAFISQVTTAESNLVHQGKFIQFTGHVAEEITTIPHFDVTGFQAGNNTPLSPALVDPATCGASLLKQNSLFITDLSVTEDQARIYNVANGTGTVSGVYTFGNLIRNICNQGGTTTPYTTAGTGISPKDFLKSWVDGWITGRKINSTTINEGGRIRALEFLIAPWLHKALPSFTGAITTSTWQTVWDGATEQQILDNAPFRLMAIVNRLDLRNNNAYGPLTTNAGETRFIYTLIAPLTYSNLEGRSIAAGTVPTNDGSVAAATPAAQPLMDWQGMNVIFEFSNPISNRCDLRDYAQQWLDLSGMTLGSTQYKDALEAICHTVLDAGRAPARPNGSALARIRTNERIFFNALAGNSNQPTWAASDWQLSQFELNAQTHLLDAVPVTNTPATILPPDANSNIPRINEPDNIPGFGISDIGGASALIEWVFAHKTSVYNGNHVLPLSYTYNYTASNGTFATANTALVNLEQAHFWDFYWDAPSTAHYTNIPATDHTDHRYERKLRQQLSLNTCQGCHAGENKTIFTQVRPVGYGQSLDYWSTIPANDNAIIDTRFISNVGYSYKNNHVDDAYSMINAAAVNTFTTKVFPRVSPFLTGRNYNGGADYADDNTSPAENTLDPTLNGLFYVFDPADNKDNPTIDNTRPNPDNFNGYNDLERRRVDLCNFVITECNPSNLVMHIVAVTSHITIYE